MDNYPLVQTKFKLPKTLIREYVIEGISKTGKTVSLTISDNHQRFVWHSVDLKVHKIRFIPISTHGSEDFRLFSFEIE